MDMDKLKQKILDELTSIAFYDVTDVMHFGTSVKLKPIDEIPKEALSSIVSISQKRGGETIVKMHDKIKALELLGRYTGLFDDLNQALATLRKFGLVVLRDPEGKWFITDEQQFVQEETQERDLDEEPED